ncbi:AAA family ATPase [Rhizobium leguminosarum]|uniref:AAA family ATPase n=1 Tax=Rhizobium ruizarguesonis TaxID=2081791 RepID=A0AAE4YSP8_9HYPH|nr:AAA family ATPase [Rhizobium ruizarguesonis]NEI50529.1 AAA family ATPase [Rhizobium ruizarguesonis]
MKVSQITLDDFRGIPHLDVTFDPHITILVGRNGLGKSSILDALAIMLFQVSSSWHGERTRPPFPTGVIKAGDRRFGKDDYSINLHFSLEDAIGAEVPLKLDWRFSDKNQFLRERGSFDLLRNFVINETFASEKDVLLLYYRQDRGFDDDRGARRAMETTPTLSLFGPLRAISQLEAWWDKRDAEEARHVRDVDSDYRDPQLQAVRDLIREIDGFVGLEYSSTGEPEGLYFRREDGARIHISSLSTGERSFIILLADLARRLQLSQPKATLDRIPAIVLIDEIELNLHPSWQSKIIETLTRVFKSCQFVVTTHSPQVISSVESGHVRMLTREQGEIIVRQPLRTKGQTSNYLLEGVFESHERFPLVDDLIDSFNAAIDEKNEAKAANLLEKIVSEVEGDPPELLVLRKRLKGLAS